MKRILFALCIGFALNAPCWSADLTMTVDTSLSEVPVNMAPLLDNTDFKSIEGAVAYNAAGMALRWHFVKTDGTYTVASVTPTTGGLYDWTDQGDSGVYTIEMPISGGTTNAMNTEEGVGWFTGSATGILPWTGPTIQFSPANISNSLINGSDKLDVNAAEVNSISTSSVTAVNANLGTTQPVNFQGTGSSANVKSTNPFFVASGTATDGGTSDLEWLNGSSTNDFYNGLMIVIFDASTNNRPHVATVTDWNGSAGILTFSPATSDSVANGDTFQLLYVPREIKGTYDSVTAGVTLANDAITAAKFDESTAFPLKSADTGDTTVLRKGSGDITGTSLNTAIDVVPTADDVADAVLNEQLSEHTMAGSLSAVITDIFDFLDGAPTFADAMSDHGYTTELAEKLERSAPTLLVSTAIVGTPTSNTEFVLASGPDENDALKGALVIVTRDGATPKKAVGLVKHYNGMTKEVELVTDPEIFAFAEDDEVDVIAAGSPAALWLGGSP